MREAKVIIADGWVEIRKGEAWLHGLRTRANQPTSSSASSWPRSAQGNPPRAGKSAYVLERVVLAQEARE
jgi:hypothetical protein